MGESPGCKRERRWIYRLVMAREQETAWMNWIQETGKSQGLDLDGGCNEVNRRRGK